jgi:hypothetical protein
MNTFPTLDDVERIAGLDEPVVRNLQITQCYHELALAVGRRTAGQANWCHFATWASKQAGQTIRREDLARALEQLLRPAPAPGLEVAGPGPPPAAAVTAVAEVAAEVQEIGARGEAHEIRETVWEVLNPLSALERAGEAVGRGNRKVFAEIGREFARSRPSSWRTRPLTRPGLKRFVTGCGRASRRTASATCGRRSGAFTRASLKTTRSGGQS